MNRWGIRITAIGAVAQALGLGIDAWMHANDPTLAAREALLTFGNFSHVLLLGGIALVMLGVGMVLFGSQLMTAPLAVRVAVPVLIVFVAAGSTFVASRSGLAESHEHEGSGAGQVHEHGHGTDEVMPDEPLDVATRKAVGEQLTDARAVALRYPTVVDAVKAGYKKVTPYVPLIGAHYMKFLTVDGTFDLQNARDAAVRRHVTHVADGRA